MIIILHQSPEFKSRQRIPLWIRGHLFELNNEPNIESHCNVAGLWRFGRVEGVMVKCGFTCFQILKSTMDKWAQYPVQMEA